MWTVQKANEVVQDDGNLMERMMERIHAHRFRSSHSSPTRQLNRHRAGFVMTHRHPSASPEISLNRGTGDGLLSPQFIQAKHCPRIRNALWSICHCEQERIPGLSFQCSPHLYHVLWGLPVLPCVTIGLCPDIWELQSQERSQRSSSPSTVGKKSFYTSENISNKS